MIVFFTIGPPGSGKTTWANSTGITNINRDDIRKTIKGKPFFTKFENKVTQVQKSLIMESIKKNEDFVISDTNINISHRNNLVKFITDECGKLGIPLKIKYRVFVVPFPELHKRNKTRGSARVPDNIILDMYTQFNKEFNQIVQCVNFETKPTSKSEVIVVDLDGTLAIHDGRSPYDLSRCGEDKLNTLIADFIKDKFVIICSGRETGENNEYKELTETWLKTHNINYDKLYMRTHGDRRPDYVVKHEFINDISKSHTIKLALDDRDQVVALYRGLGIPCWQVNYGDF